MIHRLPLIPATKRHQKVFKIGTQVRIVDFGLHHEKDGEALAVSFGSTENDYRIALDKESHFNKEVIATVLILKNSHQCLLSFVNDNPPL